jgi:hypothetical protein
MIKGMDFLEKDNLNSIKKKIPNMMQEILIKITMSNFCRMMINFTKISMIRILKMA